MGISILSSSKEELRILISGDIDHHSSSMMREQIDFSIKKYHPKTLVLDFSSVNFMDTSGIGLILGRFKLTDEMGIKLRVINAKSRIKRIIEFSGIKSLGILR